MVKVRGVPGQVPAIGVTVIVAVCGIVPALVPVKVRLPLPDAPKPIAVLLFIQLNTVPVLPAKTTPIFCPAQTVELAGCDTNGGGNTVILKFLGVPVQPFSTGVTVMIPVWMVAIAVAVPAMLPEPDAPMPMAVLLLFQV